MNHKETSCKREARWESEGRILSGRFGRQPNRPQREAKQRKQSGSEASPDGRLAHKSAFNRREAEMGFGDEIPQAGYGMATPW